MSLKKSILGSDFHERSNHLGNVLVTFSDKRLTECKEDTIYRYVADVKSQTDYSAFGVLLEERQWYSGGDSSGYRYGWNTQERVDEIAGVGNHYTAQFWEYDLRVVWRWNTDPVVKPWESPYAINNGNPILRVDPLGKNAGDYYDKKGNHLGNDGIDDDKVYTVEGTSKFNVKDFGEGGKYQNNETAYNENNGDGFSVTYEGKVSEVFKTWDPVTNDRIAGLHPAVRMKATNFINETESNLGIQLRISTGFRSNSEQESLYWQSRDGSGRPWATNARAGQSYHNYGLAIDVVEILNGAANWNTNWNGLSQIGKNQGFSWGGDWTNDPDRPHLEMSFGYSTKSLSQKPLLNNGFIKLK